MNRTLIIARSIMMVVFGIFFLVVPFVVPLNVEGIWPKVGLSLAGAVILAMEGRSWKKRLSSTNEE